MVNVLERQLNKDVVGDRAISLLQLEIKSLFAFQRGMQTDVKIDFFKAARRQLVLSSEFTQRDYNYQLKSIPIFGYLKQRGLFKDWLLPEPGSLLTGLFVSKVIVTNDFQAIPIKECYGHNRAKMLKKLASKLYRRPSRDVIRILNHTNIKGDFVANEKMIEKIESIVREGPHLPLFQV